MSVSVTHSNAGKVRVVRAGPVTSATRIGVFIVLLLLFPRLGLSAVFKRAQLVFGDVELSLTVTTTLNRRHANALMNAAFKDANRIDTIFSTFKSDSELSRLNALSKPARSVGVSPLMHAVLKEAAQITQSTGGAFDLTWEMKHPDIGKIRVNADDTVDFLSADARVNPTGLVKGFAVDRILNRLKENRRVNSATVAASGDIAHFDRRCSLSYGTGCGGALRVALRDPDKSDAVDPGTVLLTDGAVSTSGFYERGRHIRDTAGSGNEHLQVSVTAPNAVTSDALSTAMMFMSAEKIRALLQRFPGTGAVVYDRYGKITRYGAAVR